MSSDHHSCSKCGKECKDKRGLSVHESKCGRTKKPICPHCNTEFLYLGSLHNHLSTCKVLKQQQIDNEQKEKEDLIKKEYENQITVLNEQLRSLECSYKKELDLKHNELDKTIKDNEVTLSNTISSWKKELQHQLNIRSEDLDNLVKSVKERDDAIIELKTENKDLLKIKEEYLNNLKINQNRYADLCYKMSDTSSVYNTNTTNNTLNQTVFQLQNLDANVFQGKIEPPDIMVNNVNDLVKHLFSFGFSNYYRITDVSRGNAIWYKPGSVEVRDHNCTELVNYTVDHLRDDMNKQKSFWQTEYDRISVSTDPDTVKMNELQESINFCDDICNKEDKVLTRMRKLYVKNGKPKSDTSIDEVRDITYTAICNSIYDSLFPRITDWIEKTPYELGVFLSTRISNFYHTEGGSREQQYIIIKNDRDHNRLIYSNKLQSLIIEPMREIFDDSNHDDVIIHLLTTKTQLNNESITKWLEYIKSPTNEMTKEIMRGLIR